MGLHRLGTSTVRALVIAAALGYFTLVSGCAGSGTAATPTDPTPRMQSIEVTPTNPQAAAGTTTQLGATAIFSNGTHQDVTTQVIWSSSDMTAATVSNAAGSNGVATAVNSGAATISATMGELSGQTTLAVTPAVLVSIAVTPGMPSVAKGTNVQFVATGLFSDQSTQNLTSQVTWASSNSSAAPISNMVGSNGLATAAQVGTSHISASFGGVTSPNATLTVTPAVLVSVQVTPPSAVIPNGVSEQFAATGVYSDNSTQDLTAVVTWSSSAGGVATISNSAGYIGLASATGVGATSVTASFGGVTSAAANLTVTAATLVSLQVTPPNPSIANGLKQQFTATGTYTDNSTQNLTSAVTWSSTNSAAAAISNAAGSNGLASGIGLGSTSISARLGSVTSPAATLTVTAATLVSIQVGPSGASIPNGLMQQFMATGTYTDNSTQDLTPSVTWLSSNSPVASISNAPGSNGLASALAVGMTGISASFNGVTSSSVPLTVSAATLVSIQVTPADPTVAFGANQQFVATGLYTDTSQVNLTSAVTWFSSIGTVASISNAAGSNGLASAAGVGTTTITASFNGVTSPDTTLTVAPNFAGVWTYNNQAVLIMDNAGNLTGFGLLNGAWVGYNGTVQVNGSTASGTVTYNNAATHGQDACESCSDQIGGLQPTADISVTLTDATTVTFTDSTNNLTVALTYLASPADQPITDLAAAQASWNTLQSGGEPSYPTYGGFGNPYPQVNNFVCGTPPAGQSIGGTISSDVPSLGIYILTCANASYGSPPAAATGLVFMNTSGQIFGAYSNQYVFTNVSYPAGVFP